MCIGEAIVAALIVLVLAAVLFPVFAKAHSPCRQSSCGSNLKQVALAMSEYVMDWDTCYPPLLTSGVRPDGRPEPRTPWMALLMPYVKNREVMTCPLAEHRPVDEYDLAARYGANRHVLDCRPPCRDRQVRHPAETVLLADSTGKESFALPVLSAEMHQSSPSSIAARQNTSVRILSQSSAEMHRPSPSCVAARHTGGANFAFCDGHVKWLPESPHCGWRQAGSLYWYPDASR